MLSGICAKSHALSDTSYVLTGIGPKSHVLFGNNGKATLSGKSEESHVWSGTSPKGRALAGISAQSHVLSGIFHARITQKYSCGRRGGFETETDGFRMAFT